MPRQHDVEGRQRGLRVVQVAVDELHGQRPGTGFVKRLLQPRRETGWLPVPGQFLLVARALEKLPTILPLIDGGVEIHDIEFEGDALAGVDDRQCGNGSVIAIGLRGERR